MKNLLLAIAFLTASTFVYAEMKYYYNEQGECIGAENIPGYEDPTTTITKEDIKGMVYVTPEQERKMKEKIFREKLREEITIRKSQDFRLDDADALAEILAGKPRRF